MCSLSTNKTRSKTAVVGLGNPLMSDDGIGNLLIDHFLQQQSEFPDIEFIDAGTGGMILLHIIENRDKLIVVDCAEMQKPVGTIVRFTPDEVKNATDPEGFSLHEGNILGILEIAEKIGQRLPKIVIFGIQPKTADAIGDITPEVMSRFRDYVDTITRELQS